MDRRTFIKALPALTVLADAMPSLAQESASSSTLQSIILPKPEKDGGKSVLASLWERKTNRNISPQKLASRGLGMRMCRPDCQKP